MSPPYVSTLLYKRDSLPCLTSCETCKTSVGHSLKQLVLPPRNYASLECVAFPQITQTAACCTLGMRRIPQMCTFEVVAADTKLAAFQQLQGYITTRLRSFSSTDKLSFSRQSNENITISAFPLEQYYQAILARRACFADGRTSFSHFNCP